MGIINDNVVQALLLADYSDAFGKDRDSLIHQVERANFSRISLEGTADFLVDMAIDSAWITRVCFGADICWQILGSNAQPILVDCFEYGMGDFAHLERANAVGCSTHVISSFHADGAAWFSLCAR
jgi:hypothetical protein